MFDVSWNDPTRETVGERKNRKDQQANEISRGSSVRSTGSGTSRASERSKASRGGDDIAAHSKPSLFGFFGSNKKLALGRDGLHSRTSALTPYSNFKASRKMSSYVPSEPPSPQTSTMARLPEHGEFARGNLYSTDTDVSSPSDGKQLLLPLSPELTAPESVFSAWTGRSANTDSSWSSVTDLASPKGSIIQPLSRTSFVTQSTEVTVSSRDSVNTAEQLATVVHISAAGTIPFQINDSSLTQ